MYQITFLATIWHYTKLLDSNSDFYYFDGLGDYQADVHI
jgi:hypothetical protein